MKLGWLIATACLVCLFGFTIWLALWGSPLLNARPLAMKDALGPGPGFFPVWLAGIGLGLGALLLIEVAREPKAAVEAESLVPNRAANIRIGAIVVLLAISALTLEPLGFRVTAFGFILLTLLALGITSPLPLAAFAVAGSLGVFHVFYHWLKVPLPIGPFDIFLQPLGI